MSRYLLCLLSVVAVSVMSVGCCGPRGCGPGCGISACNDCDGIGYGEKVIPQRPFDRLRNGSLFCGSGCGEVYLDEWISTPPDCCGPCSGTDWVGGASPCEPRCWQPGGLLRRFCLSLLGGRNCTGAQSSVDCGCGGGCSDGGCSDGGCSDFGSTIQHLPYESTVSAPAVDSSCGCSSIASARSVGVRTTRTATRLAPPKRDRLTKHY